jgi:hypothetical protein
MTPAALKAAVVRQLFADNLAAEELVQGRALTKNEALAFKAGFYRGLAADLFRDGDWDAAAASIPRRSRSSNRKEQP